MPYVVVVWNDNEIFMMSDKNKTILELKDISKIYMSRASFFGSRGTLVMALNKVSLSIFEGEIFGLVGESGSGKTTAGRLIVKLEEPAEGRIYLDGRDITKLQGRELKTYSLNVQMIFQDPYQSLNPQFSVFDTISEPLTIHKIGDSRVREETLKETMRSVGLSPPDDFVNRYPHQLSGGQRQRVAIARAMVLKPKFVVADEPTSMLDASISAQIFNILIEMRDQLHVTLLFITHSLAAARYLCDRIAVIYKGHIMEMGSAEAIIDKPKHPYTQALIDALPKFGHHGEVRHYGTLLREKRRSYHDEGCPFFSRCKMAQLMKCSRERPVLERMDHSRWVACFFI